MRLGNPGGDPFVGDGFPIPGLPVGGTVRVGDPFPFYPDMVLLGHGPKAGLTDIGSVLRYPFTFDPDVVVGGLRGALDKGLGRQNADGDVDLSLSGINAR